MEVSAPGAARRGKRCLEPCRGNPGALLGGTQPNGGSWRTPQYNSNPVPQSCTTAGRIVAAKGCPGSGGKRHRRKRA